MSTVAWGYMFNLTVIVYNCSFLANKYFDQGFPLLEEVLGTWDYHLLK